MNGEKDFTVPRNAPVAGENSAGENNLRRCLTGISLLEYSERKINNENTLLGNRWLCRGNGAFIVGPSGIGKSTLAVQMSVEFACGRSSFGIQPTKPLRVLMIQAEDDEGDLIEMAGVINHLGLDDNERKLIHQNTLVEHANDLFGEEFITTIEGFLEQWKPDLLFVNPYLAYLGADIMDCGANTDFLRNQLNPILKKHWCGCVVIHHTPKTNFRNTTKWKVHDWMYAGAGVAELTNWARGLVIIEPTDVENVYAFICPKRGKRIGWTGVWQYWAHSEEQGKLLWVPADDAQKARAAKLRQTRDEIFDLIPAQGAEPISQARLRDKAKQRNIGRDTVADTISVLLEEGLVEAHKLRRQGRKSAIGYTRAALEITSGGGGSSLTPLAP
jgi:hypothetical protein